MFSNRSKLATKKSLKLLIAGSLCGEHRWPVDLPPKGTVMRKYFSFVDEQGSVGHDISKFWPMYQMDEQKELTQYDLLTYNYIVFHAHHWFRCCSTGIDTPGELILTQPGWELMGHDRLGFLQQCINFENCVVAKKKQFLFQWIIYHRQHLCLEDTKVCHQVVDFVKDSMS